MDGTVTCRAIMVRGMFLLVAVQANNSATPSIDSNSVNPPHILNPFSLSPPNTPFDSQTDPETQAWLQKCWGEDWKWITIRERYLSCIKGCMMKEQHSSPPDLNYKCSIACLLPTGISCGSDEHKVYYQKKLCHESCNRKKQ